MPSGLAHRAAFSLIALASLVLLGACGAGGSGSASRPSITASFEPTRSAATRTTIPTPSSQPAEPTRSQPAPTSSVPSPTFAPSTQGTAPSASPSPAPGAEGSSGNGSGAQGWWWLLVAVLVIGAIAALLVFRRRRARQAWQAELSAATSEVGWFARDLLPQLRRSGSAEAVVGGWSVAVPRVAQLEDQLTRLVATAPDEERRSHALAARDAVRQSRERLATLAAGPGQDWRAGIDAAQAPLLTALAPPPPPAPEATPGN